MRRVAVTPTRETLACLILVAWSIICLEADGQAPIAVFSHEGNDISGIGFSPDGRQVVTASTATVVLWDAATAQPIRSLEYTFVPVSSTLFSSDGRYLLTAGSHASGDDRDGAYLWDAHTGEALAFFPHRKAQDAVFGDSGQRIITAGNNTIRVWDRNTKEVINLTEVEEENSDGVDIQQIAVSSDDTQIAVSYVMFTSVVGGVTHSSSWPKVRLLSIPDWRVIASDQGWRGPVAFSAQDAYLAVGWHDISYTDIAKTYRFGSMEVVSTIYREVTSLAFSPDGTKILANRSLHDVETGRVLLTFPIQWTDQPVAYSPDGTKVILAYSSSAYVYDVSSFNTGVENWARWDE